tara:strand:- start:1669 stop:2451 length:783 start_codon:yes stop_codon:yes gene_type:complete
MNPMSALKIGTAMKDKKKRAGGGGPPPPPPAGIFPGAIDSNNNLDNIFGVVGHDFATVQANLDVASMTILAIMDLNTNALVSPYSGTNIQVADFIARGNSQPGGSAISPAPSIGSGYAGFTLIDGEITLNIANNGSDTGIGIGVSAYNPTNQRFGGATRFFLSVYHDALNLVGNGHLFLGPSLTKNFVSAGHGVQAASSPAAIIFQNPPPVASGELIFEVRGVLQSKRAGSPHATIPSSLNPATGGSVYGGNAYLSVVIN